MALTFRQGSKSITAHSYQPLTEADIVTNITWQGISYALTKNGKIQKVKLRQAFLREVQSV